MKKIEVWETDDGYISKKKSLAVRHEIECEQQRFRQTISPYLSTCDDLKKSLMIIGEAEDFIFNLHDLLRGWQQAKVDEKNDD